MRGTFANIRIKNEMLDGVEGGYTHGPDGAQSSIFDAAMALPRAAGTPLVIFGGEQYGAGSSARLGGQRHGPVGRQSRDRRRRSSVSTAATSSAWA